MIDETFFHPRIPVAVIAIGDASEALLIRSILESLGAVVMLHLIGTPSDFLKCLGQGEAAPEYIVISGHGDESGFIFEELSGDIDDTPLVAGSLPPAAMADLVNLPGRVVVSTACRTGTPGFARAFLSGGVRAYVAPAGFPDGAAIALFVHGLFYDLLQQRLPLAEAVENAGRFDPGGDLSVIALQADPAVPVIPDGRTPHPT